MQDEIIRFPDDQPVVVKIPLRGGSFALFDDDDAEIVKGVAWYEVESNRTSYAAARIHCPGVGLRNVFMHRFILGTSPGMETDHRNGNGLDNRRVNLREATRVQNAANSRGKLGAAIPYKGVTQVESGHFQATISRNGVTESLGTYETAEDAARAYNAASILADGPFACPNRLPPTGRALDVLGVKPTRAADQQLIQMLVEEGLRHDEIAERLGISPGSVTKKIERARKDLQYKLIQAKARERGEYRASPWLNRFLSQLATPRGAR